MNGNELIRRIKRFAKCNGFSFLFDQSHGKGSHGTIFLGSARTTLKDRTKEIGEGLLGSMLRDLGITKNDIMK